MEGKENRQCEPETRGSESSSGAYLDNMLRIGREGEDKVRAGEKGKNGEIVGPRTVEVGQKGGQKEQGGSSEDGLLPGFGS